MRFFRICAMAIMICSMSPVHGSTDPDGNRKTLERTLRASNPDLEIIRRRVIADLLTPPVNESLVNTLMNTIRDDGSWPDIDYIDVSHTGFEHGRHLDNMFQLSRAYRKLDSPWYQNPEVKKAAMAALDYWLTHDFVCENWWWNEMGTPGRMINTLLVLDTDLNGNQIRKGLQITGRANLEASGARPGGDLIQIAAMLGKQALFRRDETVLARVVTVMADEVKVTSGRGLKPDMSFHHRVDNVISTLSYGLGYASSFAYWAVKVAGTRYSFPEGAAQLLIDYFLDGICKSMVYGKFPDPGAKNRDLSRKGHLHAAQTEIAENLLRISPHRKNELAKIVAIRKGLATPDLAFNRFFWHSEYLSHQRPGYFASVRMHSSRNHTVEQPHNEEGLKMHHLGDGASYVSRTGREYFDIFPVWDWQKIPGTTVVQKPVHPHWKLIAKKGLSDFVGAASDGTYGAAAMDFTSAHDPLAARKAWFFFDDEYVCLGAGISSDADFAVVTTLNQCHLKGEVVVRSRKDEKVLDKGTHILNNVSWVWHDSVGYVFPEPRDVNIHNGEASGTWREINHQPRTSLDTVRMDVFNLWADHGSRPQKAGYSYVVVPGKAPADLDRYTRNSAVEVIANNETCQAVFHRKLKRMQVVFYQPGKVKANDYINITAANPCIALVKANGKSVEQLVVSDPTHKLARLQFKISSFIDGGGEDWTAVWDKKEKVSTVDIELPQGEYAGESVVVIFPLPQ